MSDDKDPRLNYGDYPEDELDENGDWDPSGSDGEWDEVYETEEGETIQSTSPDEARRNREAAQAPIVPHEFASPS